ncbi:hypothetical protein EMCRGX_G007863 [Ephydatia muelleri]
MADSDDSDGYDNIPDNIKPPLKMPLKGISPNSPRPPNGSQAPRLYPNVPPKPRLASTGQSPRPPSTDEPIQIDIESYHILPDELTLKKLVEKHQDLFPIRVHVCKGFYGLTERSSVSEGDIYNIHFVKKAKVVIVRDCSKVDYRIALNSSVKFGVLHNPEGNIQRALDGYKYPKVSDIMAISLLPKAVRATVEFKGTAVENTVDKNEIFIIKEIKPKGNRRCLVVYSVTKSMMKYLFESCEAHFSTKPYDVRLFLPEILEHFPQPFPSTCYLFVNSDTCQKLPHHLTSSAVTLADESTDLSIIASSNFEVEPGRPLLMEMPIYLDIEVQLTQPKDKTDYDQLYETTNDLMKNLDLSTVVNCAEEMDNTSTLITPLQPGENKGIELVQSGAMRNWVSEHFEKIQEQQYMGNADTPGTKTSTQKTQVPPTSPKPTTPKPTTPTHIVPSISGADLTSVRADMKRIDMRFSKELNSLKDTVAKLTQKVEQMVQGVWPVGGAITENGAQSQPSTLAGRERKDSSNTRQGDLAHETMSRSFSVEAEASVKQQNIQFLRTMDTVNMVRLLKAMGLEQYSQDMAREHITGDVLLECTEGILEKELNILSKLHRVRLLKLIDGSHSAKAILSGEGPYGTLTQ